MLNTAGGVFDRMIAEESGDPVQLLAALFDSIRPKARQELDEAAVTS